MKDTAHDQDEQLKEKLEQLSEAMRQALTAEELASLALSYRVFPIVGYAIQIHGDHGTV